MNVKVSSKPMGTVASINPCLLIRLLKVLIERIHSPITTGTPKVKGKKMNEEAEVSGSIEKRPILPDSCKVNIKKGEEIKHDFAPALSSFDECGTLSGRVRDKYGRFIENALVKVCDLHHDPITHVFTDKDGEFLICLPPGQYLVEVVR